MAESYGVLCPGKFSVFVFDVHFAVFGNKVAEGIVKKKQTALVKLQRGGNGCYF